MSFPSVRDFDGKPILGFVIEEKMPVMRDRKEWATQAYARACEFVKLQEGKNFIAEDFTVWYREHRYPVAHSEGCWGAIWKKLVKHGVVVKTGERRVTRAASTGANRNKKRNLAIVWRAR